MKTTGPTVSFADAADVCRAPWRTEAEAREQAAILDAAGWRVDHRFPAVEFGHGSGVLIVASVYDPVTFSSPGDVTYRDPNRRQVPRVDPEFLEPDAEVHPDDDEQVFEDPRPHEPGE